MVIGLVLQNWSSVAVAVDVVIYPHRPFRLLQMRGRRPSGEVLLVGCQRGVEDKVAAPRSILVISHSRRVPAVLAVSFLKLQKVAMHDESLFTVPMHTTNEMMTSKTRQNVVDERNRAAHTQLTTPAPHHNQPLHQPCSLDTHVQ